MLTGMPCSSASRPWPETWSACVCVSIVRTIRTPRRSASASSGSIAYGGSTTTAIAVVLVPDEVARAAEIVVQELVKITSRT